MVKMDTGEIKELNKWLKVLADPTRLHLLNRIIEGVGCNCVLGSDLNLAPNLISHHLAVLRDAGLITAEHDTTDARWIHYRVNSTKLEEVSKAVAAFLSTDRIQNERPACGPVKPEKIRPFEGVLANE